MTNSNWDLFAVLEPKIAEYLLENHGGNDFLTSLYNQACERGELSEKQLACIDRQLPKSESEQDLNWRIFCDAYPEVAEFLTENASGNDFFASLKRYARANGDLSDKQLQTAYRAMTRGSDYQNVRAMRHTSHPVTTNVQPLYDAFATMLANGLTKPKLRFDGFTLSLGGRAIVWVNGPDRETYGRIHSDGAFIPSQTCPAEVREAIIEISKDVIGAAKRFGHATGTCAACGRHLDRAESVKMGIGPVCAERMGLGGVRAEEEALRAAAGSATEYLMAGASEVSADLPEVEPIPEPDYTPATLADREAERPCTAEEYLAAKWG